MKPQTFAKLGLLATAQEATLLDRLSRHTSALQRYEAQREVLDSYQKRLGILWRGGSVVRAGDAKRAGQFSTQAGEAMRHLIQKIAAEQETLTECADTLAQLRARQRILQERLADALRLEKSSAQDRAAQNLPHLSARLRTKTETTPES